MRKLIPFLIAFLAFQPFGWSEASRDFDGTGDYLDVADIDTNSASTYSIWCKADTFSTASPYIRGLISKHHSNGSSFQSLILRFGYSADINNNDNVVYFVDTGSGYNGAQGSSSLSTGTWYFIAGTHDGTDAKVFVDAVQDGTAGASGSSQATDENVRVGIDFTTTINSEDREWDGPLSNSQVRNVALNTTELAEIMWKPEMIPNGLLMHMPIWGESPEVDISGNGNTGTVTGTDTASSDGPPVMFGGGLPL